MKNLKVIFMGTPLFCVPLLEALIERCNVILVVTQPDKKTNGRDNSSSTVKEVALKHNIKVIQPENINNSYNEILNLMPNIIVTCAYGQLLSNKILSIPPLGCINVHASLLPKLRGGAPINRAIINGHRQTGITIMYMVEKLDAGDIITQEVTDITNEDNVGTLHDRLSLMGRDLLLDTLPDIISGNITRTKQNNSDATFAWNIERKDERIDFSKSKREVFNQIRGLSPWPGAYAIVDGKILKIWDCRIGQNGFNNNYYGEIIKIYEDGIGVKVSNGEIIITDIQSEGKKRIQARDYLNGLQNKDALIGKVLE